VVALAYARVDAPGAALVALATFAAIAAYVHRLRRCLPATPLSLASKLTLARAALVAAVSGLVAAPALAAELTSALFVAAALELTLDTLDGIVARRRGETSELGARLDGEVDALFVLVLAALAFQRGRQEGAPGAFVLAIGAFRYFLLVAPLALPWLRGHVPSSLRAKIICNVNIGALLFCLLPRTPWATVDHALLLARTPIAALALALLAWSFSFDVRYLHARRPID